MHPHRGDIERRRAAVLLPRHQRRAGLKSFLGKIGLGIDDHFPLVPVSAGNDANQNRVVPVTQQSQLRPDWSRMSRLTLRSSSATLASNVRSAAAVRPWRPMTRPRSVAATCSSYTVPLRRSDSFTLTASG